MIKMYLKCLVLLSVAAVFSFAADPGINEKEILIGSSMVLDGSAKFLGQQTNKGLMAAINSINEKGGVKGKKIKVVVYDDGYEPTPCFLNTCKLISKDKVFVLSSFVGTPTSVKAQPVWTEAKVPVVGFFTGAEPLRTPFNRYNIHIRSSYYQETQKIISIFVNELKLKKIAVFYQDDAFGQAVKKGVEIALEKYKMTPIGYGSYVRNTMDVEKGLREIEMLKPDAIVMVGTYMPLAKFVKLAKEEGLNDTIFYTVSFVGTEVFAKELGNNSDRCLITQVVPPYDTTDLPIVNEYKSTLKKYFPEEEPNFVSFEGFLNGKVLIEGLKNMKENTRESFIDAIESLGILNLGGLELIYNKNSHNGMSKIYVTKIEKGKFVEVTDWSKYK